jgi:hypothetical protein
LYYIQTKHALAQEPSVAAVDNKDQMQDAGEGWQRRYWRRRRKMRAR